MCYISGEILIVVPIPQTGIHEGWTRIDTSKMGARIYRFTQNDINEGRIFYRHTGILSGTDIFSFEVICISSIPRNNIEMLMFSVEPKLIYFVNLHPI